MVARMRATTSRPSDRRGTGAWPWSVVPFTVKTAAGSPIVVLLVHHLCCSGCRAGDVRRPAAERVWAAALAAILGPREAPSFYLDTATSVYWALLPSPGCAGWCHWW